MTDADELTVNIFKLIIKSVAISRSTGKSNIGLILQAYIVQQREQYQLKQLTRSKKCYSSIFTMRRSFVRIMFRSL